MKLRASDSVLHPEGVFRGQVTGIEPTNCYLEGIPEKIFVVETAPTDVEGPTRLIRHRIYCIPAETSQFSRMYTAISGKGVNSDRTTVDTKALVGGQAVVVVQHYVKENGRKGHRISSWQPECFSHN